MGFRCFYSDIFVVSVEMICYGYSFFYIDINFIFFIKRVQFVWINLQCIILRYEI